MGAHLLQGQAELNLSYTVIRAPIDGYVSRRTVRRGSYVNTGTPLLAVVPLAQSYVIANFQENQLQKMRLNQPVVLAVDALPGLRLRAQDLKRTTLRAAGFRTELDECETHPRPR